MDINALNSMYLQQMRSLQEVFGSELKDKVALITGGATGLGFCVAARLAQAGAKVVIASRNEGKGRKAEEDLKAAGLTVKWTRCDVTSVEECYRAVEFTVQEYGAIDILIANAAGWSMYSFLDMPEEAFDQVVNTDMKGEYFIAQAAARVMVSQKIKGKIVFIASAAHLGGDCPKIAMMTHYNAAKGAVVSMTKGIAKELKQYGITVNCVAPGGMLSYGAITNGAESSELYGPEYDEEKKKYGGLSPLAMNPDQVALVVFAMCTSMSDFMAGETVDVNGGVMLSFQEKPWSYTVAGCIPGPKES